MIARLSHAGTVNAFTSKSADLLTPFAPAGQIFKTIDPLAPKLGCWDPVIWWDERVSRYFAMGACGHNNAAGGGMTGSGGFGLQQAFSSPAISGSAPIYSSASINGSPPVKRSPPIVYSSPPKDSSPPINSSPPIDSSAPIDGPSPINRFLKLLRSSEHCPLCMNRRIPR